MAGAAEMAEMTGSPLVRMCTRKVAEVTRKGDGRRRWGGWRDRKHVLRRSRFDRLRCPADEARENADTDTVNRPEKGSFRTASQSSGPK